MIDDVESFTAGIALAAWIRFVRLHLGHAVVFNQYLESAILGAKYASGFMPFAHNVLLSWYFVTY
jgi:hypothetical protein